MRLFTHNILQCHVKGCNTKNYPLLLRNIKYNPIPDIQPEKATALIARLLPKLDYTTIKLSLQQCGIEAGDLPAELPANAAENDELLTTLGKHLMGIDIESGEMVCEGCGHVYPITDGIPNMLLNENEI
jgi:multifunctional methyltransferase subunit TRM112